MIVDIHCHLGDILYPHGGQRILSGLPMARPFDPDGLRRMLLYGFHGLDESLYQMPRVQWLMTRAERRRNFTGTLKNLCARMDRHGIDYAAAMPLAPNVAFEDLLPAARADRRVLPFGSVDFTQPDLAGQVRRQLAAGALGFKLHPILQRVDPAGPAVAEALSALPRGAVVMVHAGISNYYPPAEQHLQVQEYGYIPAIARMVRGFPELRFIAAHGGLLQFADVLALLAPLPNAHVDTSFVSPEGIRLLVHAFGPRRVLFASDWPWGYHGTALAAVRRACPGGTLAWVLGGNAAGLLGIG